LILTDAGPLVALIDLDERAHERCVAVLRSESGPMVTTWPAFVEAMYLVRRAGGWRFQEALWQMRERRALQIHELDAGATDRARELMATYRDLPMDLADATLVAAAEVMGATRVFTLDSHFRAYRTRGGASFSILPT
jgi:hypothetical protein